MLLILLRLRLIVDPTFYVVADTPDMYTPLWNILAENVVSGSMLSVFFAIACTMLCAMLCVNTVNRYGLMPEQTLLGGFFYVVLSGGLRPSLGFQPVMIFAIALAWSIDRLFSATRKERPYLSIAWGFGIATLGALFWSKGLWFLPFLLILLILLRIGGGRHIVAALLGIASVGVVGMTLVSFSSSPMETLSVYWRSAVTTVPYWRVGARSIFYLVVILAFTFIGVMAVQRHAFDMKITESRRARVAQWVLFYSILLMLLPGFSYETQCLAAIGASIFLPRFVYGMRSDMAKEVSLTILVAVTAFIIYI